MISLLTMTIDSMTVVQYMLKRIGTVVNSVDTIFTCGIKSKMEVHETPVHRGVISLLLHLGPGLGINRKKM